MKSSAKFRGCVQHRVHKHSTKLPVFQVLSPQTEAHPCSLKLMVAAKFHHLEDSCYWLTADKQGMPLGSDARLFIANLNNSFDAK